VGVEEGLKKEWELKRGLEQRVLGSNAGCSGTCCLEWRKMMIVDDWEENDDWDDFGD
jgi:hypothetical protein